MKASTGHFRRARGQGIASDADPKAMPALPAWPVLVPRALMAAPQAAPQPLRLTMKASTVKH
jgi:hypothetical protein